MLCIGVMVGNNFYTVGGYEMFRVPNGFPFGYEVEEEGRHVDSASMLNLSSCHFLH